MLASATSLSARGAALRDRVRSAGSAQAGSTRLLARDRNREALAALAPAALQHLTSSRARHPGEKAMRPLSPAIARLVRALHSFGPFGFDARVGGRPTEHAKQTEKEP